MCSARSASLLTDKYGLNEEFITMQTADQWLESHLDAKRKILRQAIDEIARQVGLALQDAGLHFPVYITVPNTGDALATIATPIDPSDIEWDHANEIVCSIFSQWIGHSEIRARPLAFAVANGTMAAADVIRS
jgi:hypothetical protein